MVGALRNAAISASFCLPSAWPSVRPSVCLFYAPQNRCIFELWLLENINTEHILEVEPAGQLAHIRPPELAKAATKPSPTPFQTYSLGGSV